MIFQHIQQYRLFSFLLVVSFCFYADATPSFAFTSEQIKAFEGLPASQQKEILQKVQAEGNLSKNESAGEGIEAVEIIPPRSVTPDKAEGAEDPIVEENDSEALFPIPPEQDASGEDVSHEKLSDEIAVQPWPTQALLEEMIDEKEALPAFGYDLFAGEPQTFTPLSDVPVPEAYVLGPGDQIRIQIYGNQNRVVNLEINREGMIQFPEVGPIPVAGITFAALRKHVKETIERHFIGSQSSVTLGKLRSFRVFVLGEAHKPGSYSVSGLSTITHALYVSGGVRESGSLRNVQLKRAGKIVTTLDFYDLLLSGNTKDDFRIQPGDTIFIPPKGRTVAVSGAVNRPGVYELKSEKSVSDLLFLAGGIQSGADLSHTRLLRLKDVYEFNRLDLSKKKNHSGIIQNGDFISIPTIPEYSLNSVLVTGHVLNDRIQQWKKDMRLSDVLPHPDLMPSGTDKHFAVIRRTPDAFRQSEVLYFSPESIVHKEKDSDITILPGDEITLLDIETNRSTQLEKINKALKYQTRYPNRPAVVMVNGAVHFPGEYPIFNQISLNALLEDCAVLTADADMKFVVVQRYIKTSTDEVKMLAFDLTDAKNISLQPGDRITVFDAFGERLEAMSPTVLRLKDQKRYPDHANIVIIEGHVESPGEYPFFEGLSLQSYLHRCVSPKENMDPNFIIVAHKSMQSGKIKVDQIDLQQCDEYLLQPEDTILLFDRMSSRSEILESTIEQLQEQADESQRALVTGIDGSVRSPGTYPLTKGMNAAQLVNNAGGLLDRSLMYGIEITRKEVSSKRVKIHHFYIEKPYDEWNTISLQPEDRLTIKMIPNWREAESVSLKGEFVFPGTYPIARGESLTSVIRRAGGLTDFAFVEGAIFLREDLKALEKERYNSYSSQLSAQLAGQSLEKGMNEKENKDVNMIMSLIQQLQNAEPIGRLVIDLPTIIKGDMGHQDILLKNHDQLIIPTFSQEVTVIGEVQFPTSHMYKLGKNLFEYIGQSGGFSPKSAEDRVYTVKANGQVIPYRGSSYFSDKNDQIGPGDTIVVPFDVTAVSPLIFWGDVSKILYQLSTTAASLKVIGIY